MKIAPGFSRSEHAALTRPLRVRRQRDVDAEDVGASRHIAGRRRQLDANRPQRLLEAELARFLFGHRPILAVEAAAPDAPRSCRSRPRDGSFPGRCCRRRECRASARTARAPSRTPSCSICRRGARRRCRGHGDRARGSARRQARPPPSHSCPDSWTRRCRAADAAATSIVL